MLWPERQPDRFLTELLKLSLTLPEANSINLSAVLACFTGALGANNLNDDLEILGDGDGVADLSCLCLF